MAVAVVTTSYRAENRAGAGVQPAAVRSRQHRVVAGDGVPDDELPIRRVPHRVEKDAAVRGGSREAGTWTVA